MPQLDPTWFASQLFWLAITFIVMYFVLAKIVLPPLMDTLARRQNATTGDIEAAQGLKSEAERARQDYERTMAEARSRAQGLIAEAQTAHKTQAEAASKEIDRDIEKKLSDATRRIETKKRELMDSLTPATAELTALIVEKLTKRAPSGDQVSRIINQLSKGNS